MSHLAVMPDQAPEYEIELKVSTTRIHWKKKQQNLFMCLTPVQVIDNNYSSLYLI